MSRKLALFIGNSDYEDQTLSRLKTPTADVKGLAKALRDKTIGEFDEVVELINQSEPLVRRTISKLFEQKKSDDLLLLYFSGHGVLDDQGRLYLAVKDTRRNLLKATAIAASFVTSEMDDCRSRRQILILDCCHSGAFIRGGKGQASVNETTFKGNGYGRVVLTASNSIQYALEGDQVIEQAELSLFSHYLLEGLISGEADLDDDGLISLDDWYDYAYGKILDQTRLQTPQKWVYSQEGGLIIAKNPSRKMPKPVELPIELRQSIESPFAAIRAGAVHELGRLLKSSNAEIHIPAVEALNKMADDDSRQVHTLATQILDEYNKQPVATSNISQPVSRRKHAADSPIQQADEKYLPNKLLQRSSTKKFNSLSRIIAQVLGALVSLVGTLLIVKFGLQEPKGKLKDPVVTEVPSATKLVSSTSWRKFGTGFFGSALKASGAQNVIGSTGVLIASNNRNSAVVWMELDEKGEQVGSLREVPLGVNFKDPEAITNGNGYFYLVTSQSDPKGGAANALIRFDFNSDTQTLRGQADIIGDLRSYLLQNVTEISSIGAPAGPQGGLNIEGIAWDPNNERLLLGLRSPQTGNQAMIVPLKPRDPRGPFNLSNLKVDEPSVIVLSLEAHGVRDITYDPQLKTFLIISGAPETSPNTDFVLWEWNGQPNSIPTKLLVLDEDMKPEGITSVRIGTNRFVFIVGDAGSYLKLDYTGMK